MLTMYSIADIFGNIASFEPSGEGIAPLRGLLLRDGPEPDFVHIVQSETGCVLTGAGGRVVLNDISPEKAAERVAAWLVELGEWERSLFSSVGGSLQALVELAYPVFKNPIFIVDDRDCLCAHTRHGPGEVNSEWDYVLRTGHMPYERIVEIYKDREFRMGRFERGSRERAFFYSPPGMDVRGINFRVRSQRRGVYAGNIIIIEKENPLNMGKLALAETFGEAVTLWFALSRTGEAADADRTFAALLRGEEVERGEIETRLMSMGKHYGEYRLAAIPCVSEAAANNLSRTVETMLESYCFTFESTLVCLFASKELSEALFCLGAMGREMKLSVGVSLPFSQWEAMRGRLRQAVVAAGLAGMGVKAFDSSVSMAYAADELEGSLGGGGISHPALEILAEYDRVHNSEYYHTLYVWLRSERNLAESVRELHIHRNTMIYRLSRIEQLTGERFDDPDSREHALLSFRLGSAGERA